MAARRSWAQLLSSDTVSSAPLAARPNPEVVFPRWIWRLILWPAAMEPKVARLARALPRCWHRTPDPLRDPELIGLAREIQSTMRVLGMIGASCKGMHETVDADSFHGCCAVGWLPFDEIGGCACHYAILAVSRLGRGSPSGSHAEFIQYFASRVPGRPHRWNQAVFRWTVELLGESPPAYVERALAAAIGRSCCGTRQLGRRRGEPLALRDVESWERDKSWERDNGSG